jgi:nitrogen fixation/metabolism regulation signal transduction histidine kinase
MTAAPVVTPRGQSRRALAAGIGLTLLLLASLVMLSDVTHDAARFGELYGVLLGINTAGLVLFVILIGVQIRRLYRDLKERQAGARLRARLLALFVALALCPAFVVFMFSRDFLRWGIDSWFDVRIERAFEDALKLSRSTIDQRTRSLLRQTEELAEQLAEGAPEGSPLDLRELRDPASTIVANPSLPVGLDHLRVRYRADELLLLSRRGAIVATSSASGEVIPEVPSPSILLQLRQGQPYIGLDPVRDGKLAVRVVVPVQEIGAGGDPGYLQALYPVSRDVNALAENVESAYGKYQELAYLRKHLKLGFAMTLTLVLVFTILAAVFAALYSARRVTAPIRDLAEGTRLVAAGDYSQELPVASRDELGFLVQSFNDMTRQIARARDEIEAQRAYLEAVLGRLSSGVLTLDKELRLRTANAAASKVLGVDLDAQGGAALGVVAERHPQLRPLAEAVRAAERGGDWRAEVQLFGPGGRQVLMCRGTPLVSGGDRDSGHVIVFDDITALIKGQRDAAWSEVARRLAHEIKNPLTPIQLSAERLRHKYLKTLTGADAEVLDRLTHTIVQQVETMKLMVNSFSDYARTPPLQAQECHLNALVTEVLDLYRSVDRNALFETDLDPDLPVVTADPARLRQVLNNLFKNAIEATVPGAVPHLRITTRHTGEGGRRYLELRVGDRGRGVPEAMLDRLFEPYVTHKAKGTGLGLAIVKKIIEEHAGVVWMENNAEGGASAVIRLPITGLGYNGCYAAEAQVGDPPATAIEHKAI